MSKCDENNEKQQDGGWNLHIHLRDGDTVTARFDSREDRNRLLEALTEEGWKR